MPGRGDAAGASIGGGGDMYMIKCDNTTQEQYDAAWRFMRYMTDTGRNFRPAGAWARAILPRAYRQEIPRQ